MNVRRTASRNVEVVRLRRLLRVVEDRAANTEAIADRRVRTADVACLVALGRLDVAVKRAQRAEAHVERLMRERDEWRALYRRDHMAWVKDAPAGERTIPTPQEATNR